MSNFSDSPIVYISDLIHPIIDGANISSLLEALHPLSTKFYTILLIYVGLKLILGHGDSKELLINIIKIIFIATILYSIEYGFQNFLTPAVRGIRTFLENSMQYHDGSSNEGASIYKRLDDLGKQGFIIADSAILQFNWKHLSTYTYLIWALLIIIVSVILIVIMTFTMLGSELITLLLLAIGPIFIILFLFTSTRSYFFLWISATFSNIILFVICSFFIALSTSVINKIESENKIIESLAASKSISEINETINIDNSYGLISSNGTSYRKEIHKLVEERDEITAKLGAERDQKINSIKPEIQKRTGCDTGLFSKSCNNIPEIAKIRDEYTKKIYSVIDEYKKKIDELENTKDSRIDDLQKIIDNNPVTQEIYLGLILLLAILIKITSEIPGIAQTLSGGMGAGASSAALAHQGIGMAKSAAIGAISGAAGASYAALKWAKNKASPPPPSPMQQMLEKVDTLSTQVQQQTALLERFDPRPAQPHPEPTPAPQLDGDPSPKPSPAEETKPGKIKDETHIAAPQNPQNAPEPAATPPQPAKPAEEGKGQETTGAETGKTVGNDSNKIDSPEKADVNVNTHVDADVIAKGGRNSGGDGGSPNNGLPSNAAHGASGIGGAIDSAQRESAQQQSQTGSNTQPSTPATSGGSGSKGTPSASNSTTPPAPQNEKKPSITDPKGNKPPKEPPIKKL